MNGFHDTTNEEVLEQLKALTGKPSDDGYIDSVIEWHISEWRNLGGWWRQHKKSGIRESFNYRSPEPYTKSVDAAIALIEKTNASYCYRLSKDPPSGNGPYWATCGLPGQQEQGIGPTPAIALLIALFEHEAALPAPPHPEYERPGK